MSFFANDFGDIFEVRQGQADWEEGSYWLDKIDSVLPCAPLAMPVRRGSHQGGRCSASESAAIIRAWSPIFSV